jgi:ribulose 1,5-bisphosphate synthetase/thiazole synthase
MTITLRVRVTVSTTGHQGDVARALAKFIERELYDQVELKHPLDDDYTVAIIEDVEVEG